MRRKQKQPGQLQNGVFAAEYGAKGREVDLFLLEQKQLKAKKLKGPVNKDRPKAPSVIEQKTAKLFLPEEGTCSIWKDASGAGTARPSGGSVLLGECVGRDLHFMIACKSFGGNTVS